jgi:hypothetical protein
LVQLLSLACRNPIRGFDCPSVHFRFASFQIRISRMPASTDGSSNHDDDSDQPSGKLGHTDAPARRELLVANSLSLQADPRLVLSTTPEPICQWELLA